MTQMKTMNKYYSVNLVAFIYMISKIEPVIEKDHLGQVYFLYESAPNITILTNIYRNNHVSVDLKDYLAAYRTIRGKMRAIK